MFGHMFNLTEISMGNVSENYRPDVQVVGPIERLTQLVETWRQRSRAAQLTPEQQRLLDRTFDRR